MKDLTENTRVSLEDGNFDYVKCFKIKLKNQEILTYTESSEDLSIDGLIYKSSGGFDSNNVEQFSDITENSSNIVAFLNNDEITTQDVLTGKFDNAEIEIFLIDKNNIDNEKIYLNKGYFKDIKFTDNKFYVRIEGILSLLKKTITKTYSPLCRAHFCDKKCKLNKENYIFTGSVEVLVDKTNFFSNDLYNFEKNYFKYGVITFISSSNINQKIEVLESDAGFVMLNATPYFDIVVGDNFEIIAGCDKTISTCAKKFNNNENFRGEPDIPRTNKIYKFY
jgi:uncharacterized phage protein (TIGR02218 family)